MRDRLLKTAAAWVAVALLQAAIQHDGQASGVGPPPRAAADVLPEDRRTLPPFTPRLKRPRPVIAVLGYNPATEVTDFVVPYAILAESKVAEVVAVATAEGPIRMSPALTFEAQATLARFDARFPEGADYVIVPNVYEGEDDPALLGWLRAQSKLGAIVVGICDGVPSVANAGLLEGRRSTAHWRTIDGLERKHPKTTWIRNRRYIADGNIITTSGVSASIPISMALVEAIGGRAKAVEVGAALGVSEWSPDHYSEQFKLTPRHYYTVLRNKVLLWRHETLGLTVAPGDDEIRIALIADAYARTRRSPVLSVGATDKPVPLRRGLVLVPDLASEGPERPDRMLPLFETEPPIHSLDRSLERITEAYGADTTAFVALTMEYPYGPFRRTK